MSILETVAKEAVTRVRVLAGGHNDPVLRVGKTVIARSECTYYCPDAATAERCIEALRASDERLRSRPEQLMLWSWDSTYWEAEMSNPNGGGTVMLGVMWYDREFFDDRRDAWFGVMHQRVYKDIGIPMEDINVTHWLALTV